MVDACVCYIGYVSLRVTSVTDWCGFVTKRVNCHVILCDVMQWMKVRGAWVGTEISPLVYLKSLVNFRVRGCPHQEQSLDRVGR